MVRGIRFGHKAKKVKEVKEGGKEIGTDRQGKKTKHLSTSGEGKPPLFCPFLTFWLWAVKGGGARKTHK